MSATKVSSKVQSKTAKTAKGEKPAVVLVAVPSQVLTTIVKIADVDYQASVAATSREQSIINLGLLVGNTMGKNSRDVTKASIGAPFAKAYREANDKLNTLTNPVTGKPYKGTKVNHPKFKDEKALGLYIGQQLSRVISAAYPGGVGATAKETAEQTAALRQGLADGESQPTLLKIASGSLGYRKGKLVEIKSSTRGGGNKLAPLDVVRAKVKDAMESAKGAKVDAKQFLLAVYDRGVDLKWWADADEMVEAIQG